MKSWKEKKLDKNNATNNKPSKVEGITSVSQAKIDDSMHSATPMTVRMNQYHKDIIAACADKTGLNKQQVVRVAVREFCEKNGVI